MPFPSEIAYQSANGCVSWQGERAVDGDDLKGFLSGPVAARMHDLEGHEELRSHLNGLNLTGMGQDALEEVLAAEVPEERDWAAGEALAEAVLEEHHNIVLPWNTERDKRNPFASLQGADIVGFQRDGDSHRLALGEVKCSSEEKWPPQVMSGRSGGMGHQLETLANNLATILQLLKWLLPRVKGTEHEGTFKTAFSRYFNSRYRDLTLFGILIRDKDARETDLQARGFSLSGSLKEPTRCHLLAFYLPWPISELPAVIQHGGAL